MMPSYEWGTRLPNGNVCKWDSEDHARQAARISMTFPDGPHWLVKRYIGEWSYPADAEADGNAVVRSEGAIQALGELVRQAVAIADIADADALSLTALHGLAESVAQQFPAALADAQLQRDRADTAEKRIEALTDLIHTLAPLACAWCTAHYASPPAATCVHITDLLYAAPVAALGSGGTPPAEEETT